MVKQAKVWKKRLILIIIISAGLQLLTSGIQIVFAGSFTETANKELAQIDDVSKTQGYLRTLGYVDIGSFLKEDASKIESESERNNEDILVTRNNFFTRKLQMNTLSMIVWTIIGFVFYYGCVLFSRKNKALLIAAIVVAILGVISYALSILIYLVGFIYAFPTSYVSAVIGFIACLAIVISAVNTLKEKKK